MDVLVLLEDGDECDAAGRGGAATPAGMTASRARPLAYVQSGPEPVVGERRFDRRRERGGREVITLCGAPDAHGLALALAAAVEGRRLTIGPSSPVPATAARHLRVSDGAGATGDCAWRDRTSGQLVSREVAIAAGVLEAAAGRLLADAGRLIRQTVAELGTPDWPEGARRAISFVLPLPGDTPGGDDALLLLASLREADGLAFAAADGTEPA